MDFASWDDESLRRAIRAGFTTRSDDLAAEREALKRWLTFNGPDADEDIDEAYERGYKAGGQCGYADGLAAGRAENEE